MDPQLVFFAIRSLIRVGVAAREAYEQKVRDKDFRMPDLPLAVMTTEDRLQRYFNQQDGHHAELTKPGGALARYWMAGDVGGHPADNAEVSAAQSTAALLAAIAALQRSDALEDPSDARKNWINLRLVDEEAMTGLLQQWSDNAQPVKPWGRIALALADVALDYVGSNPNILGVGGNGEALIRVVCDNLRECLDANAKDGPHAYFVERMGAAILQAGLKTVSENPNLVVTDKAAAAIIGGVAKPLAQLFVDAGNDVAAQLRWSNIRDTALPQMISAGLSALAEHQQHVLGAQFDPNDTLGYFTKGFLVALSQEPVSALGNAEAWVPIYQSLLRAAATRPNLLVKSTNDEANAKAIQSLITGLATKLAEAPSPYDKNLAIDLGLVVIDELQKELPSRTKEAWVVVAPAALQAVVKALGKGGTPVTSLPQAELFGVLRAILAKAASTPGMIVGNGASVEVQAIITAVATAMAQDEKCLIGEDGWARIAAAATTAAARNPGKLFKIDDATPQSQLAGKLISKVLSKAAAGFGTARSSGVVLFGETLIAAVEDTLMAGAGNAKGALDHIDQLDVLIERLNKLVASPDKPIGAADWSRLYRSLVGNVFDKGKFEFTDEQLRKMLFDQMLSGSQ